MGLPKEQCAEWKKRHLWCYCSPVWVTNGGRIISTVTAICETFKISCLMGRHRMKGVSECPLKDRWYRLEQWLSITLFLRKTCRDFINFGPKVLPGFFLGYALDAGGSWEGDTLAVDLEELEQMDASEIDARRPGSVNAEKKWKLRIPSRRLNSQHLRERSGSENIHLNPRWPRSRWRTR